MKLTDLRDSVRASLRAEDPEAELRSQGFSAHETELVSGSKAFRAARSARTRKMGTKPKARNAAKCRT